MTRLVDTKPALITQSRIVSNEAVRSSTWSDAAQVTNALLGGGSVLVATHLILDTIPAQGTATYRYRATPTLGSSRMVWQVRCSSASPFATFTPTFSAAQTVGIPSSMIDAPPVYIFDTTTSGTLTEIEYTLTITSPATTGQAITVQTIALIELPRTALTGAQLGIPVNTQRVGEPIREATQENLPAIVSSINTAASRCRRVSQFGHMSRVQAAFSSTTFGPVYTQTIPMLNRSLYTATRSISFRVYGQATGFSGEFRLSSAKNATSTTVTATVSGAAQWWPDPVLPPAQLVIDAENVLAADGLVGGTYDLIEATARVTNTPATFNIFGLSVWEDPQDVVL